MVTLDLHGRRHDDIDRLVENFILMSQPWPWSVPFKIITGNSDRMKKLVTRVIERHGFDWKYDVPNYGCLIISE